MKASIFTHLILIILIACTRPSAELTNYRQKPEDVNPKAIEYHQKAMELYRETYQKYSREAKDSILRRVVLLLDTALLIDPNYHSGRGVRADIYCDLGEPESALADLEKLCSINPRNPYRHYAYGQLLELMGRKEQAQQALEKGIELLRKEYEAFPDSFQVAYSYATMLMYYGDLEQAKEIALDMQEDKEVVKVIGPQIEMLLEHIENPEKVEELKRSEARHWRKPYGGARR